ncbi:MAG: hypothetical protein WAN65_04885, partial [Candidatus Sulfotelmatobacter sp.]
KPEITPQHLPAVAREAKVCGVRGIPITIPATSNRTDRLHPGTLIAFTGIRREGTGEGRQRSPEDFQVENDNESLHFSIANKTLAVQVRSCEQEFG